MASGRWGSRNVSSLAEFAPKSAIFGDLGWIPGALQARDSRRTARQMAEFIGEVCHTKRRVNADELPRIT